MAFDADIASCAGLVQRADPDRFRAVMALPVSARTVLFPLYAMNVEVARAPWVTQEAMIAEMRLQWWRDALQEIVSGGLVRRHEVVTPLAHAISAQQANILDGLVEARRWDIYRDPFKDQADLDRYIDQTAGTLLVVAADLLGGGDEAVIRDAGYAFGMANWLNAVSQLEAHGRIPLVDGTPDGVRSLAQNALARLNKARTKRAKLTKGASQVMLVGWQAEPLLKRAIQDPTRVADGALAQSEARKRWSLMTKAATGRW